MRRRPRGPFIRSPRNPERPASSHELNAMLGIPRGGKLPADGLPQRMVDGFLVSVEPLPERAPGERGKRSTHRVLALCPTCCMTLSAGRLQQHECPAAHSAEVVTVRANRFYMMTGPLGLVRKATPRERSDALAKMTAARHVNRTVVADRSAALTVVELQWLQGSDMSTTLEMFCASRGVVREYSYLPPARIVCDDDNNHPTSDL
jgi:hypothetical protein